MNEVYKAFDDLQMSRFERPVEIVYKNDPVSSISKMLNERYIEWWQLDKIIDRGNAHIYYFKEIPRDKPVPLANAFTLNDQ